MTKISVVLYYWILIAAVLLFARTAGLAENNEAVIKILIVTTIIYVGVVMISRSIGRAQEQKSGAGGQGKKQQASRARRTKKNR